MKISLEYANKKLIKEIIRANFSSSIRPNF